MSDVKYKISLMLVLLSVMLTAAAQDVSVRGCRRGTPRAVIGTTRGAASGQAKHPGGDFYHSKRRQLTVLASFADQKFQGDEAATLNLWDKIFNAENLNEKPFHGSVRDYFYSQSYGKLQLTFDLQYVALSDNRYKYRSTAATDENSQYLVDDVMDALLKRDIDWSQYDWNGDGYVNQLLIVFAGKGSSYGGFGGGTDAIWPHQYWLSDRLDQTTPDKTDCRSPRSFNYDGKEYKVDCYCAVQELYSNGTYGNFGTICHEFSHCFGLPDFYYGRSKTVGGWDLMDDGNNNGGGFCPPNYSAHERWLMGWLTPTELTANRTVEGLSALSDKPQAYLLRNEGYPSEYYLVENRQQQGWDASLPGSGIVVFHVDYLQDLWCGVIYDWVNTQSLKRYSIIPANNSMLAVQSAGWAYPYSDNDELTNSSTPAATLNHENTDGSLLMNKSLTEMAVDASGKGSFRFSVDGGTGIVEHHTEGQPQVLYDLGLVRIVRCPNGEIKKVVKH